MLISEINYMLNLLFIIFLLSYKLLLNKRQTAMMLLSITALFAILYLFRAFFSISLALALVFLLVFTNFYLFTKKWLLSAILLITVYTMNGFIWFITFDFSQLFWTEPPLVLALINILLTVLFSFLIRHLLNRFNFYEMFDHLVKKYYLFSFILVTGLFIVNAIHFFYPWPTTFGSFYSSLIIFLYSTNSIIFTAFFIRSELSQEQLNHLASQADYYHIQAENLHDFKHDYHNILLSLAIHIKKQENDDALNLIKQQTRYFNDNVFHQNETALLKLGVPPIQGLLKLYMEKLDQYNIPYALVVPDTINYVGIDLIDFIRSFTILLDNAFEASLNVPEPFIQVKLTHLDGHLAVVVENQIDPAVAIDTDRVTKKSFTTKAGHKGRGLGILFKIMDRYDNAEAGIQVDKSKFTASFHIYSL
ncbi:GHKL domain-containing protein [Listeria kieliensis]